MKTIKALLVIVFILGFVGGAEAQFLKKLGKAAERAAKRTVERRVERESSETTDDALDKVFSVKDNKNGENNVGNGTKNKSVVHTGNGSAATAGAPNLTVHTAKDYVRGNSVIFHEQFSNDAIGDFPGTWNTNSSGEVVTIGSGNIRWLKMVKGVYMPEAINSIPDNSTLEMDIHYATPSSNSIAKLLIEIVALKNKNSALTTWRDGNGSDGVIIQLQPWTKGGGRTFVRNRIDNKSVLRTEYLSIRQFSTVKPTVHLSIWRQGQRMRVYLDDAKIFDLPRAFGDKNYNGLIFQANATNEIPYYVSNIVLAGDAGADTRHKLLETGSFTTSDILFETGKATIQKSSYAIIDEIGEILKSNPSKHLTIIGHTDSDGSESSNQTLSEQRSESVKNYLVYKHNISSGQITTLGKGESQPVASGNSAEAKAKNRRVEFTLK